MPLKETSNQFSRFLIIGILNTGIDFAVLNLLIFIFGGAKTGIYYPVFKTISFLVAVINSYLLNKYWTFAGGVKTKSVKKEGFYFLVVSIFGFLLNVGLALLIFSLITAFYPQNVWIASNLGAITGTLAVLFFNFIGYKFVVFK